jgi:hypothetical protein
MKIKIGTFLLLSFLFLNHISASCHSTISTSQHFTSLWKQVDSLTNLGQPKSALEVVNNIYRQARTVKNDPQFIKAIIYRIRLNSEFQEDYLVQTIGELHKEAQAAPQPVKQVLRSILAEVYWKYYQNNQYRIRDRTPVRANLHDSIETWDIAQSPDPTCRRLRILIH